MQRRWLYYGLILLVVFLIIQDPTGAGQIANAFFSWLGTGFNILRDFLDSLFASGGTPTTTTVPAG